jgi:hypothetical protein
MEKKLNEKKDYEVKLRSLEKKYERDIDRLQKELTKVKNDLQRQKMEDNH